MAEPLSSDPCDHEWANAIATSVVQNVCELPDYNSPEGQPDLLTCTVRELEACVLRAFEQNEYDREMERGPPDETCEQRTTRIWIALKGNEKALTLSEADGWEVHEVVKVPAYRANSPEDIKQSMDLLQQIHQESNDPEGSDSSVKWLAYGCERKQFAHWRQECSADCPHALKAECAHEWRDAPCPENLNRMRCRLCGVTS